MPKAFNQTLALLLMCTLLSCGSDQQPAPPTPVQNTESPAPPPPATTLPPAPPSSPPSTPPSPPTPYSPEDPRLDANIGADVAQRPDLVVLPELTSLTWSIRQETFGSDDCSRVEGNFPVGRYYTLHLDVVTANVGKQDLVWGDPSTHVDPNGDGDNADGLVYWSNCHKHYHAKHYTTYELLPVRGDGTVGPAVLGIKQGTCLEDNYAYLAPPGSARFLNCQSQGLSVGWGDLYHKNLDGQFFILGPANGVNTTTEMPPLLEPGNHIIRLSVNPGYVAAAGESCPNKDGLGRCRVFLESKYSNNVTKIAITIPDFQQFQFQPFQEWTRDGFQCSYGTDSSPPTGWAPQLPIGLNPGDPRLDGKGCPPPDLVVQGVSGQGFRPLTVLESPQTAGARWQATR